MAQIIVLRFAGGLGLVRIAQYFRTYEYQQVFLLARAASRLEEIAYQGNGAQSRYAIFAFQDGIRHEATEYDNAPVLDQYGGLDGALVGRDIGRIRELCAR